MQIAKNSIRNKPTLAPIFQNKRTAVAFQQKLNTNFTTKKLTNDFPFYQPILEKILISMEKRMQKISYSKNIEVAAIEKKFGAKGVNVRFLNNLELAKFIQTGLVDIENAGYKLPNNIFIVPPMLIHEANGAAIIFRDSIKSEAPICFSLNIKAKSHKGIAQKYNLGVCSTNNVSHFIYHEVGHWLHFQNKPSTRASEKIWNSAEKELIKNEVSQTAISYSDGTEFVAEVFSGLIDGKKYSNHVIDVYKQLKGPQK